MRRLVCGCGVFAVLACSATPEAAAPPAVARAMPSEQLAAARPDARSTCEQIVSIEVHKSRRTLRARCHDGAVVEVTAALGREPRGDKEWSGDLRTPEGRYRVIGRAKQSRFHAFLLIDYPSVEDADRALREGRITPADHDRILEAHARGEEPPGDTPLGGEIGFHGEGERWAGDSADLDWTLGCIAVSDRDLDYLIERIEPGTPVDILP